MKQNPNIEKWYVKNSDFNIVGPFDTKRTALYYMDHACTGIMKRIGKGHYENQYGEIVATQKIMIALSLINR